MLCVVIPIWMLINALSLVWNLGSDKNKVTLYPSNSFPISRRSLLLSFVFISLWDLLSNQVSCPKFFTILSTCSCSLRAFVEEMWKYSRWSSKIIFYIFVLYSTLHKSLFSHRPIVNKHVLIACLTFLNFSRSAKLTSKSLF